MLDNFDAKNWDPRQFLLFRNSGLDVLYSSLELAMLWQQSLSLCFFNFMFDEQLIICFHIEMVPTTERPIGLVASVHAVQSSTETRDDGLP